jgi:hypothetical protein
MVLWAWPHRPGAVRGGPLQRKAACGALSSRGHLLYASHDIPYSRALVAQLFFLPAIFLFAMLPSLPSPHQFRAREFGQSMMQRCQPGGPSPRDDSNIGSCCSLVRACSAFTPVRVWFIAVCSFIWDGLLVIRWCFPIGCSLYQVPSCTLY